LADGIKETLINAGFTTIKSNLNAQLLIFQAGFGVDQYIAQIILEESKRISIEMTKAPPVLDDSKFTAPPTAVEKEEIL
jgi:hypothetical protein